MKNETRLARNPDLVASDLDGDTVMMDIESGNYFALNPVGSQVWEALETPANIETVIAAVRQAFDVSQASTLEAEITEFLDELLKNKLIHEVAN